MPLPLALQKLDGRSYTHFVTYRAIMSPSMITVRSILYPPRP